MERYCEVCKTQKLLTNQKRFCSKKCYGTFLKLNPTARNHFKAGAKPWNKGIEYKKIAGDKHWHWQGGTRKHPAGYIEEYCPDHPFARHGGYVYQHRLVMERKIGRFLTPKEVIHHINKIKNDNRIENLKLFSSSGEHTSYHAWLKKQELVKRKREKNYIKKGSL